MMPQIGNRATIGVLISWAAYSGTTIRGYLTPLFQGMYAAAVEQDCNLLLACDISQHIHPYPFTNAWPSSSEESHFLPVGPWNTDGLIVVADALSSEQTDYLAELMAVQHPIVFAGFPGPGLSVVVDNAGGIRQAFQHLYMHGHRQIAYIAGFENQRGDSLVRFQAYQDALREYGLDVDPRLVAYGRSGIETGRQAMQELLARDVPFTAVLAHNDSSCMGAIEALREAGLRIPEDVALIGFDDALESRSLTPPLTTIRHPTFPLGAQVVRTMLDVIAGIEPEASTLQIPTQLIIRGSCGCRPGADPEFGGFNIPTFSTTHPEQELARMMAHATLLGVQPSTVTIEATCQELITSFRTSLQLRNRKPFIDVLVGVLRATEAQGEDPHIWQSTLSTLRYGLPMLLSGSSEPLLSDFAGELLDQARQVIGERVRRQTTHTLIQYMKTAEIVGLMTAELLAALDAAQIATILSEYLPRIGIRHMMVMSFQNEEDDLVAQSVRLLSYGLPPEAAPQTFATRQFPPPGIYPPEQSFQLALLPLAGQTEVQGFIAFEAANLDACAVIARNLAAALRSGYLYDAANEARLRAEEANRLKSRFLSMVSHDLRTPLNVIIGLSELALRDQHQPMAAPDALDQDLRQIHMNAQHLGQLIGDVLDLASSEAGQLRLVQSPLNLADVFHTVAVTGAQMAHEKGLAWQAHIPAVGPWVLGDRTRLRQIALNLISNAVKFTSNGGITFEVTAEDEQALISVSDTGLGVPLSEQAVIFDEFRRGEQTFAHGYDGIGLGLAICKQLVELHGGTIGVRSSGEKGSGATFFFTLPVLPRTFLLPEVPAALSADTQTIAFMTSSTQRESPFAEHLGDHRKIQYYRVDVEPDWSQRLLRQPPDAILLDAELALTQGWEVLAALEYHPAMEQIPLFICSLDPQTQQGTLLEFNYQQKPLDTARLTQLLSQQGLAVTGTQDTKIVLVVDDDPGILSLHTRLLREQGQYRVLQARNGREALEVMAHTRPDLVLLDLLMPEVNGFEVLEAMRLMEQTRDVPVIVLTAQTLNEIDMVQLNRGVAAVLSKGLFSSEEILGHIDAALARSNKLGSTTQRMVRRALAYIHEHAAEPLSRTQIAQFVGIAEDYLTDCFHQELGVPPMTYLTRYRIKQARTLLEAEERSIADIAQAVGFVDSAHFSRVFRREVGVSPNAYRHGERAPESS